MGVGVIVGDGGGLVAEDVGEAAEVAAALAQELRVAATPRAVRQAAVAFKALLAE